MKKGLLLSVVASSILMAGGDLAPVIEEPVAVPVIEAPSMWDFSGQAVVYYETADSFGTTGFDLFEQEQARANAGLQLNATGKLGNGFGAGFQLTGLGTLGLQSDVVSGVMQMAGENLNDAAITKAYLTWGTEGTTVKFGRQELPKSLSPFAWSESWNVFQNNYEAALVVNSSIPDTILVGAWVNKANQYGLGGPTEGENWLGNALSHGGGSNLNDFNKVNGSDGIFMVTAQNKSIAGLTLTGSYYYADALIDNLGIANSITENDTSIVWGSAEYTNEMLSAAVQGGSIMSDDFAVLGSDDTTAVGAKIAGNYDSFSAEVAYSSVDDGLTGVFNVGGVQTPLYTQMIHNHSKIASDADTITVKGTVNALGGKFVAQYGMTTINENADFAEQDYNELDIVYTTKFGENTTLLAAYINEDNADYEDANNVLRFWARYNF